MGKVFYKTSTKVIAWVLLVFLSVMLTLGVFAAGALIFTKAYYDGGAELREELLYNVYYAVDHERLLYYADRALLGSFDELGISREDFESGNTSLYFEITDKDDAKLVDYTYDDGYILHIANRTDSYIGFYSETENFDTLEQAYERINTIEESDSGLYSYNMVPYGGRYELEVVYRNETQVDFANIDVYIRSDSSSGDIYARTISLCDILVDMRFALLIIDLVLAVLVFLLAALLCTVSGKEEKSAAVKLGFIDRLPVDIHLFLVAAFVLLLVPVFADNEYGRFFIMLFVPFAFLAVVSFTVSLARRIKAGTYYKNSLIYFVLKWTFFALKKCFFGFIKLIKLIPLYYKAFIVFAALAIVEFLFILGGAYCFAVFWVIEKIILLAGLIYLVLLLRRIEKGASEMAAGDLSYRVSTEYMPQCLKDHSENLNKICGGLSSAVEKQMKSERLKSELITNVSHDIKTPLTSIINYTDLLKKENIGSERVSEYIDVIDRQSHRLKKLTEDIIEASKASAGCITVNKVPTDINVLLSQACGEYEDKLVAAGLTPLVNLSPLDTTVMADGALLWRVFDNLFNNILKYSQNGTRVYLKTEVVGESVVITFSNISKTALDISSDELIERFVRADTSRNTEGSGLGLSIAESLVSLQNGTFDLKIDADLFKTVITFKTK